MMSAPRFLLRLALFCLPLLIVPALIYFGDLLPVEAIVSIQMNNDNVLYAPRYPLNEKTFAYKVQSINFQQPDVLALGSSRVMQWRSPMFLPDVTFFNGGGPGWRLREVESVLKAIDPNALPDIILLGLDQPWFNPNFPSTRVFQPTLDIDMADQVGYLVSRLPLDIASGQLTVQELVNFDEPIHQALTLGFGGRLGYGYRNDGSLQRAVLINNGENFARNRLEFDRDLLENRQAQFITGDILNERQLQILDRLLAYADEQGIVVIGILPPFAPSFYESMQQSGDFTYLDQLPDALQPVFERYDFSFFDFTDAQVVAEVDDGVFWDGWHASESFMIQMYLHMLEAEPNLLSTISDAGYLAQILTEIDNPHDVFEDQWK